MPKRDSCLETTRDEVCHDLYPHRNLPAAGALLTLPVYRQLFRDGVPPPRELRPLEFLLRDQLRPFQRLGLSLFLARVDPRILNWFEQQIAQGNRELSPPPWDSIREVLSWSGDVLPNAQDNRIEVILHPPEGTPSNLDSLRRICHSLSRRKFQIAGRSWEFCFLVGPPR